MLRVSLDSVRGQSPYGVHRLTVALDFVHLSIVVLFNVDFNVLIIRQLYHRLMIYEHTFKF